MIGEVLAEFLATVGHFEKVELAYDNEPILAAGARMAKQIRDNNGLETILSAGKLYNKSRTSLAERTIQTVRAQCKTLVAHVEEREQELLWVKVMSFMRGQCHMQHGCSIDTMSPMLQVSLPTSLSEVVLTKVAFAVLVKLSTVLMDCSPSTSPNGDQASGWEKMQLIKMWSDDLGR